MKLNHWHDVRDWYRGFLDAGLRADVVPLAYDWTGYKTIVLPTVLSLSDEDVLRIADFAKAGGTVIVGYAAGLIDEHFHIGLGGYPGAGNGLLRDMLGIRSEEFNILGEEAEGEPSEISLSNGLTTRLWQNDVTSVAADTTVLASYAGESARQLGAGAHPRHHQPPLWQRYRHLRGLRPQPSRHCPVAQSTWLPMEGVVGAAD